MKITSSDIAQGKKNIVTMLSPGRWDPPYNTTYGNIIIDTRKFPNCIYKWMLSINFNIPNNNAECFVGIHSSSGIYDINYNAYSMILAEDNSIYYAWHIKMGTAPRIPVITNDDCNEYQDKYDKGFMQGKIYNIDMILNTKTKSMEFIDNGTKLGAAFTNMFIGLQSRLAIAINKNVSVQILDFKMHSA